MLISVRFKYRRHFVRVFYGTISVSKIVAQFQKFPISFYLPARESLIFRSIQ